MQPKVLQKLLGHASIQTTMDRYVQVTDEAMNQAVKQLKNKWGIGIKVYAILSQNGVNSKGQMPKALANKGFLRR